jgi:hypothetical protein
MRKLWVPVLCVMMLLPGLAIGAEQEVKFRVYVLLATKQGDQIDPQINKQVRAYLKKSFGSRYSSFRQLDSRLLKVDLDQTVEMPLPDESTLGLRFRDIHGEFVKLTMTIKDLRTTIRIRNGGLFFQAGHRYKNGMLILAISATLGSKPAAVEAPKVLPAPPAPKPAAIAPAPGEAAIESGTK